MDTSHTDMILPQSQATDHINVLKDYKKTCYELNNLYLGFNYLTKTLGIARTALMEGHDNTALLNYHDAA
jgi:hypothetical protein